MRLKSLRLFGFKTFAESTVLQFEPGITALVGPNGSGKSNLVDAIRWVLGEQSTKSLRSARIEDVIFAGNERRKPLGMAEVALTFDNHDRALALDALEVQITRRTYRAGESEFFINREHVRLKDVIELLMGTGLGPGSYAIVSQGQIDAILSSKPTERRALFEETAGINRFLARKAESMRRLDQTDANAIRVSDLIEELAKRVPELETQARRAKRYRKATARLRDLEILTYLRAGATRRAERSRLATELERLERERTAAAERATAVDAELAVVRADALAAERALEALHLRATAARARSAETESARAADLARRDAHLAQSARVGGDRERADAEGRDLARSLVRYEDEILPLEAHVIAAREREAVVHEGVARARAELDDVFERLRATEAAVAAQSASEAQRRARLQGALAAHERLEHDATRLRADAARGGESLASARAQRDRVRAELAQLETEAEALEAAEGLAAGHLEAAEPALAFAQSTLREKTGELASTEARLHTIEELEANLEGHVPGTRAVLEAYARGEFGGLLGVVSNLVRVDERYARALDIAFGAALSNIVTESSEAAERAIRFLSQQEMGRATFLPLDTLGSRVGRNPSEAPRREGVVGYAHALVETEPRFAGIVAYLIGRTLVVASLDVGIALVRGANFRDSIVTLDGDEIRGGGAMTGGRHRRERSILSRRAQARSLTGGARRLRAEVAAAELAVRASAGERARATDARDAARAQASAVAVAARGARGMLGSFEADETRHAREIEALLALAAAADAEIATARATIAGLDREPEDAATLDAERAGLEARLATARESIARAQAAERGVAQETATAREALSGLVARRDAARSRVAMLDQNRDRAAAARAQLEAEVAELAARLARSAVELEERRVLVAAGDAELARARIAREDLASRGAAAEAALRDVRGVERGAGADGERGRLRLAEIDAELGMLAAQFAQNPASADECAEVEARYASDGGDFEAEIGRLREELARLANVNLNAETEIAELAEREGFLKAQLDDLARAKATLLDSIAEIEAGSQRQFNETFERVKTAFESVYGRLFPGGTARIWQTTRETLAETGIEIAVQPPGKKSMALAALSGGERAMAAAALIFALIEVKPSPFYLLDEVDAALDDANVERFSALVREFAERAQLFIVTHNKKTMELASRMYGVTMAEPGISSVIAADLAASDAADEGGEAGEPSERELAQPGVRA